MSHREKTAPVRGWPAGIPWSLHLEAYAAWWGPQPALVDLEGCNCRGGFGTEDLDLLTPGWRDRASEIVALRAEVARLRTALEAALDSGEPVAHMFPSDLEKFKTSETCAQAYSVAVGNPDEHSVPLYAPVTRLRTAAEGPVNPTMSRDELVAAAESIGMRFPAFNGLTHAEAEVLACAAEECAELVKAAMKILRHGRSPTDRSVDPPVAYDNCRDLQREATDVVAALELAMHAGLLAHGYDSEAAVVGRVGGQLAHGYLHHAGLEG